MKQIIFEISDFRYNAGLVGLTQLLSLADPDKIYYEIRGNKILVEEEWFLSLDLTQLTFDAYINKFEEGSSFTSLLERILDLQQHYAIMKPAEQKETWKWIVTRLNASSYQTGYETIFPELKSEFHLYQALKEWKYDDEDFLDHLQKLINHLTLPLVKQTFYMKNIAYSVIARFISNKTFLNRNNAKKDMMEVHRKEFEEPFKAYFLELPKRTEYCQECGREMAKKEELTYTFMNDQDDCKSRKKSAFWNFEVNSHICPVCNLIYSLVPLGFQKYGKHYLFVNQNVSMEQLQQLNHGVSVGLIKEMKEEKNDIIYQSLIEEVRKKQLDRIHNFQIVTLSDDETVLSFKIIDKKLVEILSKTGSTFQFLSKKYDLQMKDKSYYNVYLESLNRLLNRQNQYEVLNTLFLAGLEKEREYIQPYQSAVLEIQTVMDQGKEIDVVLEQKYQDIAKEGNELRIAMKGTTQDDSSLIGVSYRMLNAIKQGDCHQFLDIVIRLCNATKRQVPPLLIQMLVDDGVFKDRAYAFMLGFRGGYREGGE